MHKPEHLLDIHDGGHSAMTGSMLEQVEKVLLAEKPDAVLVYGDNNSTVSRASTSAELLIPVAHVKVGLRSFNMAMPEEVNRILSDRISRWLFTPTAAASAHLRREGVAESQIEEVGDVMYDVALHHGSRVDKSGRILAQLGLAPASYVLATVHRAENTDHEQRLLATVDGLQALAQRMPVVWQLHPRTRGVLQRMGRLAGLSPNVRLIDPVGYLDMVQLEKYAAVVATDSGDVQKEAIFYRVPCVTVRDETEWVELVDAGMNSLVPPLSGNAVQAAVEGALGLRGADVQSYGAGDVAKRIVGRLVESLAS